ncbi:MAG: dolichol kinase, partial [Spirochaetia bacterium]|nr:dolichol kinase [Spirochaetia bacterium]
MDGFNFNRKLFHLTGLFVPAILYFDFFKGAFELKFASRSIVFLLICFILLSMSIVEVIRLNNPKYNEIYLKSFGKIMKEAEINRMNGVIPYMLSSAVIVAIFPSQVIFMSMAYLLIGDPLAAYFGTKYGRYRFSNGKSLVGVLAFIIASSIAGIILMVLFQSTYNDSLFSIFDNGKINKRGIIIIFIGAVSAGIAEFISGHAWKGFLEDNLLIP